MSIFMRMRSGQTRMALTIVFLLTLSPLRAGTASPKYIFLFIGDGMGFEQVELANMALQEQGDVPMRMTRLPITGKIHTRSANNEITDSAAAGTALSCGVKTDNGRIAQLPDGSPVEPISIKLLNEGMQVGILTSVTANYATPAPYYSHADHRSMYEPIALQFVDSGVHFLAGSGLSGGDDVSARVMDFYRDNGIAVVTDFAHAADVPRDQRMALLARSVGNPEQQHGDLADATALAIERMKDDPEGFFMMVEGGAIDWVCHANRAWSCIEETLAMDRAVERAFAFYLENPNDTLIIVTADHETGGLSVDPDHLNLRKLHHIEQNRETVVAKIPGDTETLTIESIMDLLVEHYGVSAITDEQREELDAAARKGNRDTVVRLMGNVAQSEAGITWSTGGHTGVDVPIYAIGANADLFGGTYDNTQIVARILEMTRTGVASETR